MQEKKKVFTEFFLLFSVIITLCQCQLVAGDTSHIQQHTDFWGMYQHDAARSGFIDASIPSQIEPLWNLSSEGFSTAVIVTDGDYAYATWQSGKVIGMLVKTGKIAWECALKWQVPATPIILGNYLIAGNTEGELYFIERFSGYIYKTLNVGHPSTHPLLYAENYILVAGETEVSWVDANGTLTNTLVFNKSVTCAPIIYLGRTYVVIEDEILSFLNWTLVWERHIAGSISSIMGAGGKIIVTTENGTMFALNALTGSTAWEITLGCPIYAAPAYYNGLLFAATYNGTVYSIFIADGSQIWNKSLAGECTLSPVVNKDSVLVAADNVLYCLLQSTGITRWAYEMKTKIISGISMVASYIFLYESGGTFYCLTAPPPELKITTSPSTLTVYERLQIKISFMVIAGSVPAENARMFFSVELGILSNYSG
ncbi:MAG: PQQ-binding-like beta-propeller repeat protein, partial [Thermoplasmata archaeon]